MAFPSWWSWFGVGIFTRANGSSSPARISLLADLPGDGSNTTVDDAAYFSCWSEALVEAASALPNLVLVAHSSGGMFALATPELENILTGLILMDSAPDSSWRSCFAQTVKENPLPEAEKRQVFYDAHPSNFLLKKLTIACASYFSTKISLDQIVNLLESLPFNYKTHQWAANHFHQTYQAKWIPQSLPTMIFAGDQDHLTPLRLFLKRQDFHRDNIVIREIKNGSHFPWIDNPKDVAQVFEEFCQQLDS